jgi:hypothetical protein
MLRWFWLTVWRRIGRRKKPWLSLGFLFPLPNGNFDH